MDAPGASRWHVSPAVDAVAYHYGWLVALVPLLLSGPVFPSDYLALFCLIAAGNVAHQTLTFPLALVDRDLRTRERTLFVVGPALVLAATAGLLALGAARPAAFFPALGAAAAVSAAWNFWHVYMQKYGILRLYAAKSGAAAPPPPWSDKLFTFGWLPLYFAVLGPRHRDLLMRLFPLMRGLLDPLTAALTAARPVLVPAAAALTAASVLVFAARERRAGASAPRVSMAFGMTALAACFLVFDPVKAALAFGFSHLLEYFVFVWAWERRRVDATGLTRPGAALLGFLVLVGGALFVAVGWGRLIAPGRGFAAPLGVPLDRVGAVFVVCQSLFHFHADGRLWKVGRPEVRRRL